jgi:hypothetical protein
MATFRKKYTSKEARDQIEIIWIQIQNNLEEIYYWNTRDDPLILALVRMTKEECKQQAYKQIEYLEAKRNYIVKFL